MRIATLIVGLAASGCGRLAFDPVEVAPDAPPVSFVRPLSPRGTFLRPELDAPAELASLDPPLILRLADEGIVPGRTLYLEQRGGFDYTGNGRDEGHLLGLFSTSDVVLDPAQPVRVPGAIDAGEDTVTVHDIAEDFDIAFLWFRPDPSPRNGNGVEVVVPEGAVYLMVAFVDSVYRDNGDDPDLAVAIEGR